MGGLREERFSGSGRGVENEGKGYWGVETIGGDGSKTGLVMKKKGKHKSMTGISASLTPGKGGEQQVSPHLQHLSSSVSFCHIIIISKFLLCLNTQEPELRDASKQKG